MDLISFHDCFNKWMKNQYSLNVYFSMWKKSRVKICSQFVQTILNKYENLSVTLTMKSNQITNYLISNNNLVEQKKNGILMETLTCKFSISFSY